jgi:hypothetical protein
MWNAHEHKYNRTNAGDLLNNCSNIEFCANIGPVQFMGGPPGGVRWITGTLRTFVMDRVMSHVAREENLTKEYGPKIRVKVRC